MSGNMGFIREYSSREVKVKEAELGRGLTEEDIPKCFGVHSTGDNECIMCIINKACEQWGINYPKGEDEMEDVKATVTSATPEVANDTSSLADNGKKKKGYVSGHIREMLKAGTTKKEVNKFLDEVGYGKPQFGYMLRCLKKEGKLIEGLDGSLKVKE